MSPFKVVRSFFFASVLLILVGNLYYKTSLWLLLPLVVVYLAILTYGVVRIQANFFLKSLNQGSENKRRLALTFDDGPHPVFTPKVLEILNTYNVSATFFVIGKNIPSNEPLIQKIDAAGHLIGNHSYSHHFWFDMFGVQKVKRDFLACHQSIFEIIGKKMLWVRPPYGISNPMIAHALEQLGFLSIGWDLRTFDTKSFSVSEIMQKIKKHEMSDSIIIMHDKHEKVVQLLTDLLNHCKQNDIEIVSLEQYSKIKAYE